MFGHERGAYPPGILPGFIACLLLHMAGCGATMPVTKNIDMKLQFEPYDCTPGPAARTFLRKCLQHGAKTDDQGWSLQDTPSCARTMGPY